MRNTTLVTGGSDGSVRVWSLETYSPIHRLAAHDNSVTSLQFDDTRIVSGGSDGRVKIWDLGTGQLMRELSQPAEAVWRVAFEEERSVVLASRQGRTVMEVWDFAPPGEDAEVVEEELVRTPVLETAMKQHEREIESARGKNFVGRAHDGEEEEGEEEDEDEDEEGEHDEGTEDDRVMIDLEVETQSYEGVQKQKQRGKMANRSGATGPLANPLDEEDDVTSANKEPDAADGNEGENVDMLDVYTIGSAEMAREEGSIGHERTREHSTPMMD